MTEERLPNEAKLRYLQRRLDEVQKIRTSIQTTIDWELIHKVGHQVKGNGESFGFPRLATMGKAFEQLALLRDIESLKAFLSSYEGHLCELKNSLDLSGIS